MSGFLQEKTSFDEMLSVASLIESYSEKFADSSVKGTDRVSGKQFLSRAVSELQTASEKCLKGSYRFAPYLEQLKLKGRNKTPRIISIPTVRDRVVLHQLQKYLAAIFPDRVPRNIASAYVREIAKSIKSGSDPKLWVCSTDIKAFYDSIPQDRLLFVLSKKIKNPAALKLVRHAIQTPTVPKNTRRKDHSEYRQRIGVPQGLAISNILASIYLADVDDALMELKVSYYRYVDDVLMYGYESEVKKAFLSLRRRLKCRGLEVHSLDSGKSQLAPLSKPFNYLGYIFKWPVITVRQSTIERFLQSVAAKFSDHKHNKLARLERSKYLTSELIDEIFVDELNEKIAGAISDKKRYGWVGYFNEINDLSLLYRMDHAVNTMFERSGLGVSYPCGLKKLSRAFHEIKYNPLGGYVRNYDSIETVPQKIAFLKNHINIRLSLKFVKNSLYIELLK